MGTMRTSHQPRTGVPPPKLSGPTLASKEGRDSSQGKKRCVTPGQGAASYWLSSAASILRKSHLLPGQHARPGVLAIDSALGGGIASREADVGKRRVAGVHFRAVLAFGFRQVPHLENPLRTGRSLAFVGVFARLVEASASHVLRLGQLLGTPPRTPDDGAKQDQERDEGPR